MATKSFTAASLADLHASIPLINAAQLVLSHRLITRARIDSLVCVSRSPVEKKGERQSISQGLERVSEEVEQKARRKEKTGESEDEINDLLCHQVSLFAAARE